MNLVDSALEAVAEFANAPCTALFLREQDRVTLFASRGIDPRILDVIGTTWTNHRASLAKGQLLVTTSDRGSTAILPVLKDELLVGLLYVATDNARFADERDRHALVQFARIASMALSAAVGSPITTSAVEIYLERTAPDDVARQQLLVLLDRNEWNIARVARLLGVTRVTIYNRIAKLGIERRRVSKTAAPKRQPA